MKNEWIRKMADGVFRLSTWGASRPWRPGAGPLEHTHRLYREAATPWRAPARAAHAADPARRRRDRAGRDRHAA